MCVYLDPHHSALFGKKLFTDVITDLNDDISRRKGERKLDTEAYRKEGLMKMRVELGVIQP